MRLVVLAAVLLWGASALADVTIVAGTAVYVTPSPLMPNGGVTVDRLEHAQFLQFSAKRSNGTVSYQSSGVAPLGDVKWMLKTRKPPIPKLEGCSEHPQRWLTDAKQVATAKSSVPYRIEIPSGYARGGLSAKDVTELEAVVLAALGQGAEDRVAACTKDALFFSYQGKQLAYCLYDDDLNQLVGAFHRAPGKAWTSQTSWTLTDNCP